LRSFTNSSSVIASEAWRSPGLLRHRMPRNDNEQSPDLSWLCKRCLSLTRDHKLTLSHLETFVNRVGRGRLPTLPVSLRAKRGKLRDCFGTGCLAMTISGLWRVSVFVSPKVRKRRKLHAMPNVIGRALMLLGCVTSSSALQVSSVLLSPSQERQFQ
jgi:hypothetical protein